MTWDLTADIDWHGEPFPLLKSLIEFFQQDIQDIHIQVIRGNWSDQEVLVNEKLTWKPDTIFQLQDILKQRLEPDTMADIGLGFYGYGDFDYFPYPTLNFYGSLHKGMSQIRRRCDASVSFGNYKAYKGGNILPASGRCLDANLIIRALEYICRQSLPESVYLLNEECVSIPWNYHFIFHSHPRGYANDVAEIIQLILHGGDERYADDRQTYESGLLENPGMIFCKRIPEHIEALQRFIMFHGSIIETQGIPETFSKEELEEAILEMFCDDPEMEESIDFFFVGEGLGIYAKPLLNRYCEAIYLSLIERLSETITV